MGNWTGKQTHGSKTSAGASAHRPTKPGGNLNSQYTAPCSTQLSLVYKQNATSRRRRRGGSGFDSGCLNLFCFTQALHTNKMPYSSRNTVALNSCFLPSCWQRASLWAIPCCQECVLQRVREGDFSTALRWSCVCVCKRCALDSLFMRLRQCLCVCVGPIPGCPVWIVNKKKKKEKNPYGAHMSLEDSTGYSDTWQPCTCFNNNQRI